MIEFIELTGGERTERMPETDAKIAKQRQTPGRELPRARSDRSDITERERELFHALMDHLPEKIYFKDRNSRFVRINRVMAEFFGLKTPAEAVGKSDRDFFSEEHASQALEDEKRILETGLPIAGKEEKETWPDGHETWACTTKAPLLDRDGKIVGTFGISSDITREKENERQYEIVRARMKQLEKAESLGMLASGVAHDFNNLLTAVLGSVSLAITFHETDDEEKKILKSIEEAATRATELSNLLLAYAGRGSIEMKTVDFGSLVAETLDFMDPIIPKHIVRRRILMPGLPCIEGDATQIRQVIRNLVANAAEAIGGKPGTITVSTRMRYCDTTVLTQAALAKELSPGFHVIMEVSDTGCGMSREVQEKVFDPFFTTKATGKGIGLAIVMTVVRRHKGAIKIYSEPGKGSVFKVLIPASARSAAAVAKEEAPALWRGSGTVLVVDDEDLICRISSKMIGRLGFKVLSATSGQQALDLFENNRDEVVAALIDEAMPQMSGSEVLARMLEIKPGVRAILCSGYPESDVMNRSAGKGFAGFLQKPFTVRLIAERLKAVLEASA